MSTTLVNSVYYPSWRVYHGRTPSSLQLGAITHVFYAFLRVNEDGTLRHLDEYADCQMTVDEGLGCLSAVAKLKVAAPQLKTLISVGGGGGSDEFPIMAANPAARATFANSCRDFLERWGMDGVDIDWEHPTTPQDGANYMLMMEALRNTLPATDFMLTTALPVGEYCLKHINLAALGDLLDYLNLMCYDFTGSWTDVSGHHAQLLPPSGDPESTYPTLRISGHGGVEYVLGRGFPAKKLVLGVPVYARSFEGTHGAGQPFKRADEMDYNELPPEWIHRASVDASTGAASFIDNSLGGKGFVSFDNPDTVRRKAEYVKCRMGLAGMFYWTGAGDINGPESLVRAGYQALMGCT